MKTKEELVQARTKAQAKYDKGHTTWLEKQGSKQGAIKKLIREEIARNG